MAILPHVDGVLLAPKNKAVSSYSFIIKSYIDEWDMEHPSINKTTTVCGGIINLSKLKHI